MLTLQCLTFDCADPQRLAQFWADLLGWTVNIDAEDPDEPWVSDPAGQAPDLLFLASTDPRHGKNRLHWDLRPADQAAEVERALALGATRVDIGQTGDEFWTVLADPEGNEFCILRALPPGE